MAALALQAVCEAAMRSQTLDPRDFHVRVVKRCAASDRVCKTNISSYRVLQHYWIGSKAA